MGLLLGLLALGLGLRLEEIGLLLLLHCWQAVMGVNFNYIMCDYGKDLDFGIIINDIMDKGKGKGRVFIIGVGMTKFLKPSPTNP